MVMALKIWTCGPLWSFCKLNLNILCQFKIVPTTIRKAYIKQSNISREYAYTIFQILISNVKSIRITFNPLRSTLFLGTGWTMECYICTYATIFFSFEGARPENRHTNLTFFKNFKIKIILYIFRKFLQKLIPRTLLTIFDTQHFVFNFYYFTGS